MRKSKIITIDGRGEVTVKEVSPWAVYQAWGSDDRLQALETLAADALDPGPEVIRGWYASEIEAVIAAFLEVNQAFFGIARQLKLDGLLDEVIKSLSTGLPAAFAGSFHEAMQTPGITVGRSS